MNIEISPEVERLVQDLIDFGGFASPTEVFEAGVRELVRVEDDLDEQDLLDIEEAERQIEAGETVTLEELRREFLGET